MGRLGRLVEHPSIGVEVAFDLHQLVGLLGLFTEFFFKPLYCYDCYDLFCCDVFLMTGKRFIDFQQIHHMFGMDFGMS